MLIKSNDAKDQITDLLRSQGYATYARLLQLFDVYLTDDPNKVAYMIPQRAAIVINKNVDEDSISVLLRHEILHEYLTHYERQIEFEKNHPGLKPPKSNNKLANIAADFDISNTGYTDADKNKVRNIMIKDRILSGLVTEDEHPDWINLTFEEMYEKLLQMRKDELQDLMDQMQQMGDMDSDDLQDIIDQIDETIDQLEGRGSNNDDPESQDQEDQDSKEQKDTSKPSDQDQDKEKDKDELKNAKDQVEKMKNTLDKMENDNTPLPKENEKNIRADIEARAEKIQDALKDISIKDGIRNDLYKVKNKEKIAKASEDQQEYQSSGLRQFTLSLNRFIKNEIEDEEELSYRKPNASYSRSKFIVPSYTNAEGPIPLVNVYHDVSWSFKDEAKTAAAMQAIATLNKYVRQGELKVNYYYFADRISNDRASAGDGTRGKPILEHIIATKPQNVIVITDSDISDCEEKVTVPGAVWMLFYDGESQNLINHLKGAKETRYYLIKYKKK